VFVPFIWIPHPMNMPLYPRALDCYLCPWLSVPDSGWMTTKQESEGKKRNRSCCLQPEPLKMKRKNKSKRREGVGSLPARCWLGKWADRERVCQKWKVLAWNRQVQDRKSLRRFAETGSPKINMLWTCYSLKVRTKGCFCSLKSWSAVKFPKDTQPPLAMPI
jgi:hypothetical protein